MDIILIHFGGNLPEYISQCIGQINDFTSDRIIIYAPHHRGGISRLWKINNIFFIKRVGITNNWDDFKKHHYLMQYGYHGFWQYACERFYAIEAIMKELNLNKALHIENDNLIYFKPDYEWLNNYCNSGIGLTRMNEKLLNAGIMYIGSLALLELMNKTIIEMMKLGESDLRIKCNDGMVNEQHLLHLVAIKYPEIIKCMPSIPENDNSKYVYDCASWGQFVGGTFQDPDIPFAHDSHIIGKGINNGMYGFKWFESNGIKYPIAINNKNRIEKPIFNLHIHSKNLMKWRT